MIDAKHNFDEGVKFLLDDYEKDIGSKILLQRNFLDSQRFNETMSNIEAELNTLYEKTRVLEDMTAYTKEFLEQEIHRKKDKLYDKLKMIEETRDTLKESAYISYRAPLKEKSSETLRDRDGTTIDRCDIENGNLILSGQLLEEIRVVEVSKKQELIAYNDSLDQLKDTGQYRTFYLLDGPATNGVKEEITFMFDDVKKVSAIKARAANCLIESAALINENGVEEQVITLNNSTIAEKNLQGVKLTIVSRTYEAHEYNIDEFRMQEDFWSTVTSQEHQKALGQRNSYDFEKAAGMKQYNKEYEQYLKDLAEWKKEKRLADERNRLILTKYYEENVEKG
ncbi:hypothetical protein [Bacillus atrophaeus]|uniref:hypothetical protein n=1 Tax=Bacillus atrophaeus TaxID=1452 RepID=UPI002E215695|nr:hypothetical protein [Bacillus atrophaeus]